MLRSSRFRNVLILSRGAEKSSFRFHLSIVCKLKIFYSSFYISTDINPGRCTRIYARCMQIAQTCFGNSPYHYDCMIVNNSSELYKRVGFLKKLNLFAEIVLGSRKDGCQFVACSPSYFW